MQSETKTILISLALVIIVSGCSLERKIEGDELVAKNFEEVSFRTKDGFTISGNLTRKEKGAVILLHQFQVDRSSYDRFAGKLADENFTVLAIDLRGHGKSLEQNGLKKTLNSFTEQDFRDMVHDVEAAEEFLKRGGYEVKVLIGSSIGANTAVNYAAIHGKPQKIILLSPGLDYKGIETEKNAKSVKAKALVVASEEDSYSAASSKTLNWLIAGSELKLLRNAGHGTNMFRGTNLENELISWIRTGN